MMLTNYPGRQMPKGNGHEPTQETEPEKGDPVEIPIPTRKEVFRDLGKVAKPRKPQSADGEGGPEK
jgi:hypothetical protein